MILVTGCAGFIGSHLAERLLSDGHKVAGIDCFTDYYSKAQKEDNMKGFLKNSGFTFHNRNILDFDMGSLKDVECIFHMAAQPGVRGSWGSNFSAYVENNILATQKMLELARNIMPGRFVFASSSSIYGNTSRMPVTEDATPRPISPYGATKLAGEHLCNIYSESYGLSCTTLRYFTVYGPRQRPDMAMHRFIKSIMAGEEIQVFGDGSQTRDFTFVSDAVDAAVAAMGGRPGTYNIASGSQVRLTDVIRTIEKITGKKAIERRSEKQKGDVRDTYADIGAARKHIGYSPKTSISEGLEKEMEWFRSSALARQ